MNLKSFGCSFIFGSELHDQIRLSASQHTWPAIWARHLNLRYQCYASPGIGNVRIAEQVLNQIQRGESAVYVIGWTWIERFDFVQKDGDKWRTLSAWDSDSVAANYYRDIHSQYWDKLQTLTYVNLVVQQLLKHQHKFFMTYMDDLMLEHEFHCTPAMQLLQQQIKPYLHQFQGMNFLDWSHFNGFEISQINHHPLEAAHQAAFEYVKHYHSF